VSEIWVAGEALIDLIEKDGESIALVGGGPANTAKALARLGHQVKLINALSYDSYGEAIIEELWDCGVDLSLAYRSKLPTAIAQVALSDEGYARYDFSLEGSATFSYDPSWLPQGSPSIIYLGTLSAIVEPGASHLYNWAKSLARPIVFDPNVRSSVLSDREKYRSLIERWFAIADVVKMSREDHQFLYGERDPAEILEMGPKILIVTGGSDGLTGYYGQEKIRVPALLIDVIDTIGAGDSVGAIVVEALAQLGSAGLLDELERVLTRAAKAGAITCSRAGANPPFADELD
jgi:fructokinase